jgi:deazaflavin-dependent oxidoreductase (nitroreductase family)
MSIKQHLGELVVVVFALVFTRTPWLIRLLNPLMCWQLVTGLPMGPNALLTVRGRGTGRPRSSPVAFLDFGEKGFLQAASNKVNWVRNVRASGEAVIRRGRTSKTFEVTELPPETAGRVLQCRAREWAPFIARWLRKNGSWSPYDLDRFPNEGDSPIRVTETTAHHESDLKLAAEGCRSLCAPLGR